VFPIDRGTLIGWTIYFFGTYEPEVRAEIVRYLEPGDVAIDVGANVGWHTLLMASRVGAGGRVFALEPNVTTRKRLDAAIETNALLQVTTAACAAADHDGRIGFEAPDAGEFWDGTGRLRLDARQSVDCVTLDRFVAEHAIDRLALIKIDVEGWELAVLRGAARVLRTLRPHLLFEFDPAYIGRSRSTGHQLSEFLRDNGYQLLALGGRAPHRVSQVGEQGGNFLALPFERTAPSS
jgi:FkbM family methyltransferase